MAHDVKARLSAYREQKVKEREEGKGLHDQVPVEGSSSKSRTPDSHPRNRTDAQIDSSDKPSPSPWYVKVLKIILWLILWRFCIEVEFGIVFVVTSALYFMCVSLRGSKRQAWEPSAYSVFNKNFEAIDGTLSADQFERELRYGPAAVRK